MKSIDKNPITLQTAEKDDLRPAQVTPAPAKPPLAQITGLKIGEHFSWRSKKELWIDDQGLLHSKHGYADGLTVCDIINHPECITRSAPRLTEPELSLCKAVGARWLTRNKFDSGSVEAWTGKPAYHNGYYCDDFLEQKYERVASFQDKLFPSIHPGDRVCLEDLYEEKEDV